MAKLNLDLSGVIARFEYAMKKQLLFKSIYYKKVFGGKGFEFDSYRRYDPTDDMGLIDWKATARAGNTLVRQYVEERDTSVFFLIDVGDNMLLGTGDKLKIESALEIMAAVSHLIISSGDSVGMAFYNQTIPKILLPAGGIKHFYGIAKSLSDASVFGGKSNLKKALQFIEPRLKKVSAIFIISDFLRVDEETLDILRRFMLNHETIGIMLRDDVDIELPDLNQEVIIEDIDSGEQVLINPHIIRSLYRLNAESQKNLVLNTFKKAGSDIVGLTSNENFIASLASFLKTRARTRKIGGASI